MQYFVTGNLKHDGREYKRGDQIDFAKSDSAAARLLELGVIQETPVEGAPPQPKQMMPVQAPRALSPDVRAGTPNAPQTGSEGPVQPSEEMKRDELEAMAVAEGISEEDAKAAANKGALIEAILAHRDAPKTPEQQPADNNQAAPNAPQTGGEQLPADNDPSANL